MCVFFFGREYHDFLLCFDARTTLSLFTVNGLYLRIGGPAATQAIIFGALDLQLGNPNR